MDLSKTVDDWAAGNDSLTGDETAETDDGDFALGGADSLSGGAGNDSIFGGAGNDWQMGGSGTDTLVGGFDDDILIGDTEDDQVTLGNGRDVIIGGDGDDNIISNSGDKFTEDGDNDEAAAATYLTTLTAANTSQSQNVGLSFN